MIITFANNWNTAVQNGLLTNADLIYVDLRCADLSCADLQYANLSHANLSHADLQYADLSFTNLSYADLSHADLSHADLLCVDLSYADLHRANLQCADLSGTIGNDREVRNIETACGTYRIVYTDTVLQIGCQRHTIEQWKKFDDDLIFKMDGAKALGFWTENKSKIFNMMEGGAE